MSGVAEVRATIAEAQERLALNGTRTVLFIDEIHRFNKAQQDALLPHVEDGTVTLIGATTENPYFEVNAALLSRMRVWRLEPLTDDEVARVVRRALDGRGARPGRLARPDGGVALADDAFEHLVSLAGGDARPALNVLEGAVGARRGRGRPRRRRPGHAPARGRRGRRPAAGPRLRPGRRRPLRHRLGVHQEPARQRPRRRALLAGGDDRGRRGPQVHRPAADHQRVRGRRATPIPRALQVAVAAGQALDWIGLPEAQYALAQATTYIATAPKSNRSGAGVLGGRRRDVEASGALPVPLHLRNAAHRGMKQHGIGVGYRYPHDFEGADVEQQYLPDELADRRYYLPTDQGYEATIAARMAARAEARAAAKAAGRTPRSTMPAPEVTPPRRRRLMKTRETNRKKLAETEKRDAGG